MFKPTLKINRLVVSRNMKYVLDLEFHDGLNIIRGENSAGKTTILRFIAHALGSENINFNQYASLCDETIIEISCNDIKVTLKRSIKGNAQKPMMVFWGPFEEATNINFSQKWEIYPFRRSENKESFSQILFRLLEMPELRGESGANITMHQLLRLMYSDQETTSADLFRAERFDAAITRAAIGDYLLGIDGNELYGLKLEQNSLDKDLAIAKSAMKTIYSTFGIAGTNINFDFLEERIASISSEIQSYQNRLQDLNTKNLSYEGVLIDTDHQPNSSKNITAPVSAASVEDDRIRAKLFSLHTQLSSLKQRNLELKGELADTELFLEELRERFTSLGESSSAEIYVGTALFKHCPSCFSTVDVDSNLLHLCPLCKTTISKDAAKSQLARMRNELALQLKESTKIRDDQIAELNTNLQKIPSVQGLLNQLEREYKANQKVWRSAEEIEIQNLARSLGSKEEELRNNLELSKLANLLKSHSEEAAKLESRLEWIKGRIQSVIGQQESRRDHAYLLVANNLKELLHKDLDRQVEFRKADVVDIDFAANRISIDGLAQFSASSMVYLKHSFHLALLFASTQEKSFRFPRLILLDGIEDGGMELERSYDFQKLIRDKSESTPVQHQIILATSNICPELDNDDFIVGERYTHTNKSLKIN